MESTGSSNPIEADMFSSLHTDNEVQTTTSYRHNPQEAVIRKTLHPPSAVPEFCGIPTNDARSQVNIEWRNMEIMQTPRLVDSKSNVVFELEAIDLKTFDYAFLIPNGARVKSIGFVYNAQQGVMMQDLNGVMLEQLYNFENWPRDVNLYRPIYKSSTFYLNATAFNDTGMVVGNQFNPNILFSGTLGDMVHSNPKLFYSYVKSAHSRSLIKIHQRPTREIVEAWETIPHYHRTEALRLLSANPTDAVDLDPNTSIQIINLGQLAPSNFNGVFNVPTTSQILGNSLRSLGCKAKEGMFSVQRLNTVAPAWLAGSNTLGKIVGNPQPGLYQCWVAQLVNGEYILESYSENAPVGTESTKLNVLYDTLWSKDMTWSWVRFSGLSLNSQTSVSTQLVIKKTYCGYEVQPCYASAWAGMMKLGPKPDLKTMQAMMDAFYELKDVMPARYNFWGSLGTMAAEGIKTFGASILSGLASKIFNGGGQKGDKKKNKPKQPKAGKSNITVQLPAQQQQNNGVTKSQRRQIQQIAKNFANTGLNNKHNNGGNKGMANANVNNRGKGGKHRNYSSKVFTNTNTTLPPSF